MKVITLNENAESRSQHKAIQYLIDKFGVKKEDAEDVVRNKIKSWYKILNGNKKLGKFIYGITRIHFDSLSASNVTSKLNTFLEVLNHNEDMYKELDSNFNGMSLNELLVKYKKEMVYFINIRETEQLAGLLNVGDDDNDYKVVRIESFEQASKFSKYVSWCITQEESYYDDYTEDGNVFYFLLKNGFTNLNKEDYTKAKNNDEYALSMIAVSVKGGTDKIVTCNTRRNRDLIGHDHQLDWVDISKMIGHNIKEMIRNAEEEYGEYSSPVFDMYLTYHKADDMFEFKDTISDDEIDTIVKEINEAFYRYGVIEQKEHTESIVRMHKGRYIAFSQMLMSFIKRDSHYLEIITNTISKYYYDRIERFCKKLCKFISEKEVYEVDYDIDTEFSGDTDGHAISKLTFTLDISGKDYYDEDEYGDTVDVDEEMEFDYRYISEIVKALARHSGMMGDYDTDRRNSKATFSIYEDVGEDEKSFLNTSEVVKLLKRLCKYADEQMVNDLNM